MLNESQSKIENALDRRCKRHRQAKDVAGGKLKVYDGTAGNECEINPVPTGIFAACGADFDDDDDRLNAEEMSDSDKRFYMKREVRVQGNCKRWETLLVQNLQTIPKKDDEPPELSSFLSTPASTPAPAPTPASTPAPTPTPTPTPTPSNGKEQLKMGTAVMSDQDSDGEVTTARINALMAARMASR